MLFRTYKAEQDCYSTIDARGKFADLTEEQNDAVWCMYQLLDRINSWLADKEPEEDAPLHEKVEYSKIEEYAQSLYDDLSGEVAELYVWMVDSNASQGLYDDDGNLIPKADKN